MASWSNRAEPSNPLVLDKTEDYRGELSRFGDEETSEVLDLFSYALEDNDQDVEAMFAELSENQRLLSIYQSFSESEQEELLRVAQLICEAADDSFITHDQGPEFDIRLQSEEDLKGLEAVVEGLEELGFSVVFNDHED